MGEIGGKRGESGGDLHKFGENRKYSEKILGCKIGENQGIQGRKLGELGGKKGEEMREAKRDKKQLKKL